MNDKQNRKLKIIILALLAFFALIWAILPEDIVFGSEPVCMHYKWFGLQCPFCGLSRAGYRIMHLQFQKAWCLNPFIFYVCWLYILEWTTLLNISIVWPIRKLSWWIGLVLVLIMYGIRLFNL